MIRKLVVFLALIFTGGLLSGCSFKKAPAALQIKSKPIANVFIDGKLLGKTPYQASDLKAGEMSVKLIPESDTTPLVSWEGKVKINSGVLTLIERELTSSEGASSGQILTLEKIKDKNQASLSVVTDPDGALVKVDGESKGFAPLVVDKFGEGDHEILISKDGYTEKTISAKAILGYRLIINVKLAQAGLAIETSPTVTPTFGPSPKPSATPKPGKSSPTPVPTKSQSVVSPTPGITGNLGYILIKENSLGFLRVRNSPGLSGTEIAKIQPIDPQKKYLLLEEKSGWYKIVYEEGKEGWVSGTYATKVE